MTMLIWTFISRFLNLAWVVQQFSSSSNIPLFILDTRHPWIEENRSALSKIDAQEALCNSSSALRDDLPPIPPDLFARIEIANTHPSTDTRLAWQNADARSQEILNCTVALETCEHLNLDIYVHRSTYDHVWEPPEPPDTLPGLFKDMLERMPNMKTLEWSIACDDRISFSKFNETFSGQPPLKLDQVENLNIEAYMDALVLAASNLQSLEVLRRRGASYSSRDSSDPWQTMIKAAGTKRHLESFTMTSGWSPELVKSILVSMPRLKTLEMGGSIGPDWVDDDSDTLKKILSVVKDFKHLTHLALPSSSELGLGFDGGPWCGNAYFGAEGTKYGREVSMQYMVATEKAAAIVLTMIPSLDSFSIGDQPIKPERTETGEVTLRWPWTGRIREHLLEEWPRYTGGDGAEYGEMEDPDGPVLRTWEDDELMFADGADLGKLADLG